MIKKYNENLKRILSKFLIFSLIFSMFSPILNAGAVAPSVDMGFNFIQDYNQNEVSSGSFVVKNLTDTQGTYASAFSGTLFSTSEYGSGETVVVDISQTGTGEIYGFTLGTGETANILNFIGVQNQVDLVAKIESLQFAKNLTDYYTVFENKDFMSLRINFKNGYVLDLVDLIAYDVINAGFKSTIENLDGEGTYGTEMTSSIDSFISSIADNIEYSPTPTPDYELSNTETPNNVILGEIFEEDSEGKYSITGSTLYKDVTITSSGIVVKNLTDTQIEGVYKNIFINTGSIEGKEFGASKSVLVDLDDNINGQIFGFTIGAGDTANKLIFLSDTITNSTGLIDSIASMSLAKNITKYNEIFTSKEFLSVQLNFGSGKNLTLLDLIALDLQVSGGVTLENYLTAPTGDGGLGETIGDGVFSGDTQQSTIRPLIEMIEGNIDFYLNPPTPDLSGDGQVILGVVTIKIDSPLQILVNNYHLVGTTLTNSGILNNFGEVTLENVKNFDNLYFEVENYGEINFNSTFDLSSEGTIQFLMGLEDDLTMTGGYIEFDPNDSIFNTDATLSMEIEGENAPLLVDYINSGSGDLLDWINVLDSEGTPITGSELESKISSYSGSCDGDLCTLSFDTTGFTSFELDYSVLEEESSTEYEVTFNITPEDGIAEVEEVKYTNGGTGSFIDGTYEYTASGTGYVTKTGSFEVSGDDREVVIELSTITGSLQITDFCDNDDNCGVKAFNEKVSVYLTGSLNGNPLSVVDEESDDFNDDYSYLGTFVDKNGTESESYGYLYNSDTNPYYDFFLEHFHGEETLETGTGKIIMNFYYQGEIIASDEKEIFYDTVDPVVTEVTAVDNNDGTFTLTATGTDNFGIKEYYWYESDGFYDNYFETGSSITITPDRDIYYVRAYDYVYSDYQNYYFYGNYGTGSVEIELQVDKPENLTATGISDSGFTISWDEVEGATDYEVFIDGVKKGGTRGGTGYTFENLVPSTNYYPGVKAIKGELKSAISEIKVRTIGNDFTLNINLDEECLSSEGEYEDWLSVSLTKSGSTDWTDNKYEYKELTQTGYTILFENISGDYDYYIYAGKCGNVDGEVNISGVTEETVNINAGKYIKTIVRENTSTGNIVSEYNIELLPNITTYDWENTRQTYVSNQTGTLLNLGTDDYKINIRDLQTWTNKDIIGIFKGGSEINTGNILENSDYNSGAVITVVVQEGFVLDGTSNIGNGYIGVYDSGTNKNIAGGSIRNGKFTIMGIPSGNYIIKAYPSNYKYNNYEETLNISSNITSKVLTFTQKNLDISGDFSKEFALEGKRISLKINPNQNDNGTLSFASGSDIIDSATYKVLNGSGNIDSNGNVTIGGNTNFNSIAGKTITVDMVLKNNIPNNIDFLNANFEELELSLPIVRINYNSPATVLANTNFKVVGSAPKNSGLQLLYSGELIGTGSSDNNGSFEITSKITTAGTGTLLIKDTTNNINSESSNISVGSDLPILQSYDIEVNDTSRANSSDGTIKYFSIWAKGNLTSADKVKVSTTFTNSPTKKYYIGGIELTDGVLVKGTEVGYGTKDVVVEYIKNGKTYTQTIAKMVILIDPAGYVYNKDTNEKLAGITAKLFELVDKNGNRVTSSGASINSTKLSNYRTTGSGYTKEDVINDIDVCKGGGSAYPCTWSEYDSTGYGEEPNPQITDSEGKYAWMTPTGFYYVDFTSNDTDKYDHFESQVVFIPPEVTDLDIGISYKSGYQETETSTNYDRIRTWNGSSWGDWVYTCKNSYTGNTCQTAPSSSGGGGGSGGGSIGSFYSSSTTNGLNSSTNSNKGSTVSKGVSKYVSGNKNVNKVENKVDELINSKGKEGNERIVEIRNEFIKQLDEYIDAVKNGDKEEKEQAKEQALEIYRKLLRRVNNISYEPKNVQLKKFSTNLDKFISKNETDKDSIVWEYREDLCEILDDLLENKDKYTKEEIAEKVKEVRELYKKIQEELKK